MVPGKCEPVSEVLVDETVLHISFFNFITVYAHCCCTLLNIHFYIILIILVSGYILQNLIKITNKLHVPLFQWVAGINFKHLEHEIYRTIVNTNIT